MSDDSWRDEEWLVYYHDAKIELGLEEEPIPVDVMMDKIRNRIQREMEERYGTDNS